MAPPPVVTGISPKEGPPGTRVTLRGENLGTNPNDLKGLKICGCDCLLSAEWKSPNKIIARSGPGKGKGDIIVSTLSGGQGTSTVQFKGYHETIGPLKESAVWVEETSMLSLAWGRRSLSPIIYQQEDPLGLSVEGNEKKFPEDDLLELFPDGSGDLASENFVAGWFLLENHHATTFDDLKAGLSYLRRKVEGQKEGQLSFLKAYTGSVIDQLDTLTVLKEKLETDMKEKHDEPMTKVEACINESISQANKLFEDVLARRDRADATRNALAVLQRYRFLFCLPVNIERNIQKGDYDVIINDYTRVKNLFSSTDVQIFKKVLTEVDRRVEKLQEILKDKLQEMPASLETQKKIIKNLVNLEAPGDPAWDALSVHSAFITNRLATCKEEYLCAEISCQGDESGKTPKNQPTPPKYSKSSRSKQLLDSSSFVPQRVLFVDELSDLLVTHFPDLWKLGQSYFSGDFNIKIGTNKQMDFKRIVLNIIELYCSLLRAALIPQTLDKSSVQKAKNDSWPTSGSDIVGPWMPECLRYVRSTYSSLIRLDLPSEALQIVSTFIMDLRIHSMGALLNHAADQVLALKDKETWKIEYDIKHGGITQLPSQFEVLVQEVVELLKEAVLIDGPRESSLLGNSLALKELSGLVQHLLQTFTKVLDKLAFIQDGGQDDHSTAVSQLIGSPMVYSGREKEGVLPVWEIRLLTTLSNCQFTCNIILPHLKELFAKHKYPNPDQLVENTLSALVMLENQILEVYLEHKSDPLVGTIEPSMYLGRFDWDTPKTPTDVRPYAKEILVNMIAVHAEIQRVSPHLVPRVLSQIVITIAEELSRLMTCVTKFSKQGNQQARIDILAIKEAVKLYTNSSANGFFEEALEAIPLLPSPADKRLIEDVLNKFRVKMKLQLICFADMSSISSQTV